MPKKKKNDIISATADIVIGGTGLLVGGTVVGALGSGRPALAGIERTAQSGLQLTAAGLPIRGASAVFSELKKLSKKL